MSSLKFEKKTVKIIVDDYLLSQELHDTIDNRIYILRTLINKWEIHPNPEPGDDRFIAAARIYMSDLIKEKHHLL